MNWETLVCFGDSITIGARTYLGYPEYAGDLLQKAIGNSWNVINIATSGFTACDLLRRITVEANIVENYKPNFFTLLIGTNDVKTSTSMEEFRIAYDLLVLKILLSVQHKNGLLFTIPQLRKGLKYPYTYEMNTERIQFNLVINEIGQKYKLAVLDIELNDQDFFDGIHLNEKGGRAVATQIANYILKKKGLDLI